MAFIFVPNADGSFTEGDKQTNPDTGVEYIYTDGAWRALGPEISDEFDTLDNRYVRLEGTTVVGDLYRLRGPNAAGTGLSSFQNISDGEHRLYNIALPEDSNTGWAASVQYVQNYVQTAVGDVDLSEYLPLAGGTMTGDLNMESADIEMLNSRIDFYNSSGDRTMEIAASGFIKSRDMLRVVREDGGPILEGRTSDSSADIKVKIDSDGYFQFRDRGELYGDVYLKNNKRYIVQGAARTNVAQLYARTDNIARFEPSVSGKTIEIKGVADPVDNRDAINLQYLNGLPFATDSDIETAINNETVHLPLAGGTLSGQVTFNRIGNNTNGLVIKGKNGSGDDIDLLRVYHNSGSGSDDAINYKGRQDADTNIVTNAYVKENYAAKNHNHSNLPKIALWKAVSPSTPAGNLQEGEFFVADNNNLYLHFKSNNGIDLGVAGGEYAQSMTYLTSIYATGTYNSVYSTVADKINLNVSSNNYIRVQSSHLLYKQTMNVGTQYIINIPGFTP